MKHFIASLILISNIFYCSAQTDFESSLQKLTQDIATKLNNRNAKSVGVWDFVDLDGNTNTLTKYISDKFAINLVNDSRTFGIMSRNHLNTVMKEHKLASQGFISEATIKKIGQFTSVDIIITGTITVLSNKIEITVNGLNTETGLIVVAGSTTLPNTSDIKALMGIPTIDAPNSFSSNGEINSPVQTGEKYSSNLNVSNSCQKNKTGDYCFKNISEYSIVLNIIKINASVFEKSIELTLNPNELKCIYDLYEGVYDYRGSMKVGFNYKDTKGQVKIEQCKSKTLNVFINNK